MTIQCNRTIWQYNNIKYVRTFICIKTFVIRFENIHKVVRIDNIRSASVNWMNHICKLVIECETSVVFAWWTQKKNPQMSTTCNYLEDGIWIADDIRVLESSIIMAITISIKSVALLGLEKFSIIWRPLFSCCVSLRMLSSLNTFNWMGIPFLLIPNLPPSSPPCLGSGIVTLLQSSISWLYCPPFPLSKCVCHVCHRWIDFWCLRSKSAPFVIVLLVAHCIGSKEFKLLLYIWHINDQHRLPSFLM